MSYQTELKQMMDMSLAVGTRADYTQGGGGNTSVKLDGDLMAIKASGYRLCDVTETEGYVTVKYNDVANYYRSVDLSQSKDFETESVQIAKDSVSKLPGMKDLRPSVEVGFHSVMEKYVLHTHTVYGNLLACTVQGEALAGEIFAGADYGFIWLPYITPGFTLTLEIDRALTAYRAKHGRPAEVVFMQNHGLVVHSGGYDRVLWLHEDVNSRIRQRFSLADNAMGDVDIKEDGADTYVSVSKIVLDYLAENELSIVKLDEVPLYPDQLVYLNNTVRLNPDKMVIGAGTVRYNASYKESLTLEQTLAAFIFIVKTLRELKLPISVMGAEDVNFINNWEVEKFRRSVAK